MKAILKTEEVFTVKVGENQVEHMRVASKWNGLLELRTENGEKLIVFAPEPTPFAGAFADVFGDVFGKAPSKEPSDTFIIMGSPDLIARLGQAKSA